MTTRRTPEEGVPIQTQDTPVTAPVERSEEISPQLQNDRHLFERLQKFASDTGILSEMDPREAQGFLRDISFPATAGRKDYVHARPLEYDLGEPRAAEDRRYRSFHSLTAAEAEGDFILPNPNVRNQYTMDDHGLCTWYDENGDVYITMGPQDVLRNLLRKAGMSESQPESSRGAKLYPTDRKADFVSRLVPVGRARQWSEQIKQPGPKMSAQEFEKKFSPEGWRALELELRISNAFSRFQPADSGASAYIDEALEELRGLVSKETMTSLEHEKAQWQKDLTHTIEL